MDLYTESKEIAYCNKQRFVYKTRNQWKINYSEVTIKIGEENGLTVEDFETRLNYKVWSHCYAICIGIIIDSLAESH